jgi:hypothetical protein
MEQVFADAFYDFQENSGDQTAVDAYIDLVDLYLRVLSSAPLGWWSS